MTAHRTAACLSLLALAVAGCGSDDEQSSAAPASRDAATAKAAVDAKDFKFVPQTVQVKAGGSVTFANSDKAKHNAQTDSGADGAFNTGDLQKGDEEAVTFEKPGSYDYYCIYHRFMTGTVEVSR